MDVQDRSLRLDVTTIAAPSATPTPATSAQTPRFADAFQRAPSPPADAGKSSASSNSAAQSRTPPGNSDSSSKPAANDDRPTSAANGADNSATTSATQPSSSPASSTKPDANPPVDSSTDDTASVNEDVESLVAGLVAATTVVVPAASTAASDASPVKSPPASLIKALQATTDLPGDSNAQSASVPADALPQIPAGLQAGLAQTSPVETTAAPALTPGDSLTAAAATVTAANLIPDAQASAAAANQPQAPTNDRQTSSVPTSSLPAAVLVAAKPAESTSPTETVADATPTAPTAQAAAAAQLSQSQPVKPAGVKLGSKSHTDAKSTEAISLLGGAFASVVVPQNVSGQNINGRSAADQTISGVSSADRSSTDDASLLLGLNANSPDISRGLIQPFDAASAPPGTDATPPSVVDQLHPALHEAISTDRRMTITLRPPELGAVQIDVTRQDGQLSARLQTETASAQQLLTDHLPQLREVLSQMGVSADQVQIVRSETSSQNPSSFGSQADMQNAGGRQDPQQQRSPDPQLADEPPRDDAGRPDIRTRTALNLRI